MPGAIAIAGASWALWQETTACYNYAEAPSTCPICGGVGWVWRGWFSCDGRCGAIAVIADGRTFLPVPKTRDAASS
jgi:hypothetical protein